MIACPLIAFILLSVDPSQLETAKEIAKSSLTCQSYLNDYDLCNEDLMIHYLALKTLGFSQNNDKQEILSDELKKSALLIVSNQIKILYTADEIELLFAAAFDEKIHSIFVKSLKIFEESIPDS